MGKIVFRMLFATIFAVAAALADVRAGDAGEVLKTALSAGDPEDEGNREAIRPFFVPEERDDAALSAALLREIYPRGSVDILKEEYEKELCWIVCRSAKTGEFRLYCLEKRDGEWLLNNRLRKGKYDRMLLDSAGKSSGDRPAAGNDGDATGEPVADTPVTLDERYAQAKKRLEELRKGPSRGDPELHRGRIAIREGQLRCLEKSMELRREAQNQDPSKFDARRTASFKQRLEEYLKNKPGYGYVNKEREFMLGLVQELKKGGIDPNVEIIDARYDKNSGPLIKFILSGRTACKEEVVTELLRLGVKVPEEELKPKYSNTRMVFLCLENMDELKGLLPHYLSRDWGPLTPMLVRKLLYLNHNVTERDDHGDTALHLAVRAGKKEFAEKIICLDADVNALNAEGQTPLFDAMKWGDPALISLLIRAGADLSITDNDGKRADEYGKIGKFRAAVSSGDLKAAQAMLDAGITPDTMFGNGDTALQTACLKKNYAMVELLLDRGADPDLSGPRWFGKKTTPAQMVFANTPDHDAKIFSLLMARGADPNKPPIRYNGNYTMLDTLCWGKKEFTEEDQYLDALLASEKLRKDRLGLNIARALIMHKSEKFIRKLLPLLTDKFPPGKVVLTPNITRHYSKELIDMLIEKGAIDKTRDSGPTGTAGKKAKTAPTGAVDKTRKSAPADATGKEAGLPAWLPGPTPQWHVRMDTALAAAAGEHKKIFVLSTGSNWCGWCRKLYNEVLSRPEFLNFAKGRLVLVYLDLPHSASMPEFQKLYNKELGKAMHFSSGVPAAFIFDENGRQIGTIRGYRPLDKYMQALREILKKAPEKGAPLPPAWMRKSPKELTPMLEELREKKKQNALVAAKASEAMKGKVSFRVVAWGLDKDKVDTPFDPRKPIRVPAGTRVYFKVRYRMPAKPQSILYLQMPKVDATDFGKRVSGSGECVSMVCYRRKCRQTTIQMDMKLLMEESKVFLAAELPCDVTWQ